MSSTQQLDVLRSHPTRELTADAATLLAAGDADAALELFNAALERDQALRPQLWQRGLALYYAGRFAEGAKQFVSDLTVNGDDAEEVVWARACALRAAAAGTADVARLVDGARPGGDDRPVMEAVRALFAGGLGPEELLGMPFLGEPTAAAYAHFYTGLWHECGAGAGAADAAGAAGAADAAARSLPLLAKAAAAPSADYMGQVQPN